MSNKPLMQAMQGLRRSNAAGPHVTARRKGTRTDNKRKAINESREGR